MEDQKLRLIAKQITDNLTKELEKSDNGYAIDMTTVTRKSDSEILKIGDRVIVNGTKWMFTIGKITQISDEIIVAEPEYGMIMRNIENLIKVPEDFVSKGKSQWE